MKIARFNIIVAIAVLVLAAIVAGTPESAALERLLPDGVTITDGFRPGLGNPIGTVALLQGEVVIIHTGERFGYRAEKGRPLFQKDMLVSRSGGRAYLEFKDGSRLTVGSRTRLVLDRSVFDPDKTARQSFFRMAFGRVRFLVKKYAEFRRSDFKVKTPTAVVGVRGSDFVIRVYRIGGAEDTPLAAPGSAPIAEVADDRLSHFRYAPDSGLSPFDDGQRLVAGLTLPAMTFRPSDRTGNRGGFGTDSPGRRLVQVDPPASSGEGEGKLATEVSGIDLDEPLQVTSVADPSESVDVFSKQQTTVPEGQKPMPTEGLTDEDIDRFNRDLPATAEDFMSQMASAAAVESERSQTETGTAAKDEGTAGGTDDSTTDAGADTTGEGDDTAAAEDQAEVGGTEDTTAAEETGGTGAEAPADEPPVEEAGAGPEPPAPEDEGILVGDENLVDPEGVEASDVPFAPPEPDIIETVEQDEQVDQAQETQTQVQEEIKEDIVIISELPGFPGTPTP